MFINDKSEINTKVLECYEYNNKFFAVLEDTIFYPLGGGQNPDKGTINDVVVLDVFKRDGKIIHEVTDCISGDVVLKLDIKVRFNNSRLHSAQHLFSAVFEEDDIMTTSFNMSNDHFTMDIVSKLSRDELNNYEKRINKYIQKSLSITTRQYNEDLDSELNLSNYEISKDDIQLVIIEDLEKNICGGTHLTNTNQIEFFKIVKLKYMNEKTRITAYVGEEAINYVNNYFDKFNEILVATNQNEEYIVEAVSTKFKENKKLKKQISKLEKKINE